MKNKIQESTVIKMSENNDPKGPLKPGNNNDGNKPNSPLPGGPLRKPKASQWIWILLIALVIGIILWWFLGSASNTMIFPIKDKPFGSITFTGPELQHIKKFSIYNYGTYGVTVLIQYTVGNKTTIYQAGFRDMGQVNHWLAQVKGAFTSASVNIPSIVNISTKPTFLTTFLTSWLPLILIVGASYWIMKRLMLQQGGIGKMSKSTLAPQMSNVKFSDVAGYDEVKAELWEIVDFLKNPNKYTIAGARIPKGVLLSGAPGTGKTFLAKAVAGEANIPFYSISGSNFVEMFVGLGAKRVRELFAQAKQTAPSLIFIDELDAVGRQRGAGLGGGNDEREQTLNQMLVEMDGFASNTSIVVIAATNRPDVLDPALKRPGRFDRSIEFRLPDILERQAILEKYAKSGNKNFDKTVDWSNIAGRTQGFSAAELENVVNEAAILSIRLKRKQISLDIIDEAIDRVIGGPSKPNNLMSLEEKTLVAYHEAGHALIGLSLEHADKVQKITIIPRGSAGGYVMMTPKKEKFIQTKLELESKIISYMAGRASEAFFFGDDEITTGASADIESATMIARRMVTEFGMSKLGPVQYEKPSENVFLGRDYSQPNKNYSGQLAHEIDKEVRELIDDAYQKAYKLISENKKLMDLLAEALLIKETLNAEESEYIFVNKKLPVQIVEMKANAKKRTETKKETPKKDFVGKATASKTEKINIDKVKKEDPKQTDVKVDNIEKPTQNSKVDDDSNEEPKETDLETK